MQVEGSWNLLMSVNMAGPSFLPGIYRRADVQRSARLGSVTQ